MKLYTYIILLTGLLAPAAIAQYDPNHFDPDNAAHWYRKAFALYEEPNDYDLYDSYLAWEIDLAPEIEQYLKAQKPVIDLIAKGSDRKFCDWEYKTIPEEFHLLKYGKKDFPSRLDDYEYMRKISTLLVTYARYMNSVESSYDFKYLEYILRLSSQMNLGEALGHLSALAMQSITYKEIRLQLNHNLNHKFSDLKRVKSVIKSEATRSKITFADTIPCDIQHATDTLSNYKRYIQEDEYLIEWGFPAKQLTESFYRRNLAFYKNYMQERKKYLDLPYPQTIQMFNKQHKNLQHQFKNYFSDYIDDSEDDITGNHAIKLLINVDVKKIENCDFVHTVICTSNPSSFYSIDTRTRTYLNALQAGVDILIEYHSKKILPEKPMNHSPKDLFSGKPFELIKTDDGFILKCQGKEINSLGKEKYYEYEFKLPKLKG